MRAMHTMDGGMREKNVHYLRRKAAISATIEGVVLGGIQKVCMSLTRGFLRSYETSLFVANEEFRIHEAAALCSGARLSPHVGKHVYSCVDTTNTCVHTVCRFLGWDV